MHPTCDQHDKRFALINTAGGVNAVLYTTTQRGRAGYHELIDHVHRKLEVSLLHATTKMHYRFQLVA